MQYEFNQHSITMNHYITNIKINKIFHLKSFEIPIRDQQTPHLIITGKNGSGKTILMNAIAEFLENVRTDKNLNFLNYRRNLEYKEGEAVNDNPKDNYSRIESITFWQNEIDRVFGKVEIEFNDICNIATDYHNGNFLFAFYQAYRKPQMWEPENPTKPNLNRQGSIKDTATSQFLNFLSDLKIQEALARNEDQLTDANNIKNWFDNFEVLLSQIYEDNNLRLEFNYKDYSFRINTSGKSFKFTELSDGYAAILEIISDLILKMQNSNSTATRVYEKRGVVIIDEIETHLHLGLQKIILPILTNVFPNIQFIITTHSPFVLSSLPNAIAFDLEKREIINELTEYSYEALAEGYFGVKTESSYMELKLNQLRELLQKEDLNTSDKIQLGNMIADFKSVPDSVSPIIKGEFKQLLINHSDKIIGI